MLIYGTRLVVLPFRKDTLTDEQEGGVGEGYVCFPPHVLLIHFQVSPPKSQFLFVSYFFSFCLLKLLTVIPSYHFLVSIDTAAVITFESCASMLNKTLLRVNLFCRPKSSFLPSYIIDVRELDEKLLNIIDMKFLHGYYEPTLLILFEPNQTWPGSVHRTTSYNVNFRY